MSPTRQGGRADGLARVSLALSSGGFGGAGGMAGFVAALDLFFGSHPVTAIGNYSGVSAGSVVSSYIAAGISPLDIVKALFDGGTYKDYRPWTPSELYRPNLAELRPTGLRVARAALRRMGLGGAVGDEHGLLPSGMMSADGIVDNIRENLARRGIVRFSDLSRRLSIIFYDILTNSRVVAGNGKGEIDLPVAEAIAASAAIPGIFPPRRIDIDGRTVLGVDGGTGGYRIGVRDLDDVDLVIAYNHASFAPLEGKVSHVSAPTVVGLSLQLSVNQSNIDELASWIDTHPAAHAWVFQPPPRPMRSTLAYASIFEEARECFGLCQRWLREHFDYFSVVLANHGVTVDPGFDKVSFDDVKRLGADAKPKA